MNKLSVVLPTVIAFEALMAGIIYAFAGSWGSALYWFPACAITIGVTMIPVWG